MTTQTESLKLALEALEEIHVGNMTPMAEINWNKAITAIKEALTQQEGQSNYCLQCEALSRELAALKAQQSNEQVEPAAVVDANDDGYFAEILPDRSVKVGQFLFAHPPVPTAQPHDCTRSHPHEEMSKECELRTEIARLTNCLKMANAQAEHFEREWYLRGDEIERLTAQPKEPEQEPVAQSRPFTKKQRDTLCTVYAIASASTTANSLPNIAKIVNELLTEDLEVQPKEPEQEKNLLKRVISWMEKVSDSTPENTDDEGIALVKDIYKALMSFQDGAQPAVTESHKHSAPHGESMACQYAKDVAMQEYQCVGRCQYASKPLTLEQLREHWQVAKVLDMTDAEIDFADYVLITRDIEALHGIKE